MSETNITRRRVVQGTGAIGVAGLVGSTVGFADEHDEDEEDEETALRVAHASPDAPAVDVRLGEPEDDENDMNDEEDDDDGVTNDDEEADIEGLEFREVTEYTEVEPDTYRVQIMAAEDDDLLDDLFDDDEDEEERILYDEEVEFEEGTTYTAIAFGELARAEPPLVNDEEDEMDNDDEEMDDEDDENGVDNDDEMDDGTLVDELDFGEYESFETEEGEYTLEIREVEEENDLNDDDEEMDDDENGVDNDEEDDDEEDDDDRAFQVELLEDDITEPEEGQSRVRVFHAVPDVDAVTISVVEDPEDEEEDDENDMDDDENGADDGEEGDEHDDEGVQEAEVELEGSGVYSGFALGYFYVEELEDDENDMDDDDELDDDDENDMNDDENDENDDEEEFELVVVEDAMDGERSDGGTNGFLSMRSKALLQSD